MKQENPFRMQLSLRRQNQLHNKSIQIIEGKPVAVNHTGTIRIHSFEGSSLVEVTATCPLKYRLAEIVFRLLPADIARIRKHPNPSVAKLRVQLCRNSPPL